MSRYTYAGTFQNPTENFFVKPVGGRFQIWIHHDRESDGSARPDRKHTSAPTFDEPEQAEEYLDGLREFYEEDYDEYLDENHAEIAAQERYESFRNEY